MSKPIEASIVVVDDESSIRELLVTSLHLTEFEVNTAASGSEAIEAIEKVQPDFIVLDVMLPGIDGFAVTYRIRQEGINTPVLFLTARDDTQDKIMGPIVGGDDYVTKPFSLEEVMARIRATLRHTCEQVEDDPIIRVVDLEINEDSHDATRAGQLVDLSPTEYRLPCYLIDDEGRVLSRVQTLDHVRQYDWGGDAAIAELYIPYLRKRVGGIEVDDGEGDKCKVTPPAETKRNVGHTICESKNQSPPSITYRNLMSISDKQLDGVSPSDTPNAAPNMNPMPAMSPFAVYFQEQCERKKNMLMRHINRIPSSSKLVACTVVVLFIGVSVISSSIRVSVNNYTLQKTDTQSGLQSQLVVSNIDLLSENDSSGPNSYFLWIQYTDGTKDKEDNPLVVTSLMSQMQDGIVSVPILPAYGGTNGITFGQAFTTQVVAKQVITMQSDSADSQNDPASGNSNSSDTITKILTNPTVNANHAAIVAARAPWHILPVIFQQNGKDHTVMYIGLSLAD